MTTKSNISADLCVDTLPNEVQNLVFGYFTTKGMVKYQMVCKKWRSSLIGGAYFEYRLFKCLVDILFPNRTKATKHV